MPAQTMNEIIRVYIRPKSPFPKAISSDTLFGAICYGISELYDEEAVTNMLNREKPPFIISSAFPFIENDGKIEHFFPKPIVDPARVDIGLLERAKRYKKAAFIHESIFYDWINGEISELKLIEGQGDRYKVEKGLLMPKGLDIKFDIKTMDLMQNILNRLTTQSENFFYLTRAYFLGSGLFFILRFYDDYKKEVLAAMRFLEDRGLGGDISTGKGWFEFFLKDMGIPEAKDGNNFVTLSRYCPTKEEIAGFDKDKMWYELEKIQGRCQDGVTKRSIFMFREGSTFQDTGKELYGKIEKVRENPDVVEFGYAFPVKGSF